MVKFEEKNSFRQFMSSFKYLNKKVISDNSEFISENATFAIKR